MTVYIFLYFCHNTYHRYICPVLHNNRLPDSYLETSFVVGRIGGTYVRADFSRIYRTMFRFYYCRRTNRSYDRPFYYSQICRNYPHSRSYIAVRRHHILGNRTWKPVLSFSLEYPVRHPVSDSGSFQGFSLVDGSWPWQRWQIFSLSLPEEADSREVFLLQSCA